MFEVKWILERIRKGKYYFSKHGDQERQNDNLTIAEVEEALLGGRIVEQYEDTGRGESCNLKRLMKGEKNDEGL
jgi:hypothetical protein